MRRASVLIADDHRMFVEGLRSLLADEFDLLETVDDGLALVNAVRRLHPDVIVSDISMPQLGGIDALILLRNEMPNLRMVFLTMHNDVTYACRALEAGALGYVLKHSAHHELQQAIRAALVGRSFVTPALAGEVLRSMQRGKVDQAMTLTPRQREVLQLLAEGLTTKQIATRLTISARTVEFHKYTLMESIGAKSMAELIRFAVKHGVVSD